MSVVTQDEEFSPERIRYALEHWGELEVAAEGGVGSLARGGGGGDRLGIAGMLADIERASDQLPIDWLPTLKIFRAQRRQQTWADRRRGRQLPIRLDDNHTVDECLWRMARFLGWSG